MTLEAISGSATVAIACAIVFFLAAKSWQLFARSLATHLNFPDSIMREAAQRFRDEFEQLSRQQSAYVATRRHSVTAGWPSALTAILSPIVLARAGPSG